MAFSTPPCRICAAGQRISTVTFAIFAAGLALAAMDPTETLLRQTLLALCAALSGLAVFRFPIARLVVWMTQHRPAPRTLSDE